MRSLYIILLLLTALHSSGQKNFKLKDLFTEETVIWFGIDYTKTQFIGTYSNKDMNEYFHGWNKLIPEESYKYDVAKSLHKQHVVYAMDYVEKINKESIPNIRSVSDDSALQKSDMVAMIAAYQCDQKEGLGVVLIAERYNNPKKSASHYAVIFDVASRKILISQHYDTPPEGIGLRNYWAPAIQDSLKLLERNYRKWKEKYGG